MDIDKRKQEAVHRLELLDVPQFIIESFQRNEMKRMCSDGGVAVELDPKLEALVHKIEEDKQLLIYHIIHSLTSFGELYTMLYISHYEEEWEQDRADIEDGYPFAYVHNESYSVFSEFGVVGVVATNYGLARID